MVTRDDRVTKRRLEAHAMRGKITKRKVDAVKPHATKDEFLWDNGFGVRVKPSGARSFVLQYYAPGLYQTKRRLTIGAYGPMTVEEARKEALALLARIGNGEDPASEAAAERRAIRDETVQALFPAYLQSGIDLRRASTLGYYESLGRLYILPALGKMPVARVTMKDVTTLHRSLRGKKTTANRVVQLLGSFFNWLLNRGLYTGENPAKRVERYPETARERYLTDEEMGRLGEALRVAESVGLEPAPEHVKEPSTKRRRNNGMFAAGPQPANPVSVAALRLLMLTGWREKEALTLRWDAVDFRRAIATLEDTKAGRSIRSLHAAALDLIAAQPQREGSPYVFPGRIDGKPIQEIQRLWYAVRTAAGLDDLRLHDLRHNVASIAVAQGHSLFQTSKLLGHKDQRSTARYAHLADDARQSVTESVGGAIDQALRGGPQTAGELTFAKKLRVLP
jgi:integrase